MYYRPSILCGNFVILLTPLILVIIINESAIVARINNEQSLSYKNILSLSIIIDESYCKAFMIQNVRFRSTEWIFVVDKNEDVW